VVSCRALIGLWLLVAARTVRESDHNSLLAAVKLPPAAESPARGRPTPPVVKWDLQKREQYQSLIESAEFSRRRADLMAALDGGLILIHEVISIRGGCLAQSPFGGSYNCLWGWWPLKAFVWWPHCQALVSNQCCCSLLRSAQQSIVHCKMR